MSRRKGLSAPVGLPVNALRMGTVIKMRITGQGEAFVMISAIVTAPDDEKNLYLLLTPHSKIERIETEMPCDLVRRQGQQPRSLGTLVPPHQLLGEEGEKLGLFVLRLDHMPLFGDLKGRAIKLATVRNFRRSIWSGGCFNVRRLNDDTTERRSRTSWTSNRLLPTANRKGRVIGETGTVEMEDLGTVLHFSYCGLVTCGRDRPLADAHGLGAPVISESGALSGIIVGAADQDTLVYPFEELQKNGPLTFVTLGEDWPKVKVAGEERAASRHKA